jgi:hypothetical protein
MEDFTIKMKMPRAMRLRTAAAVLVFRLGALILGTKCEKPLADGRLCQLDVALPYGYSVRIFYRMACKRPARLIGARLLPAEALRQAVGGLFQRLSLFVD